MCMYDATHSTLFIAAIADSASCSLEKRTNPKPRLRPVSRSLTTTFAHVSFCHGASVVAKHLFTYCFIDLPELLEFRAQGLIVGMPCEATAGGQYAVD